ncbi:HNH endonuclease family protein [Streptomyces sp. NPDC088147]|uniref:HNH endonuclease family protein n=1 Tax=unclassified Streptomyces TaxID=2593676 RepID=UPI00380AAEA5
MPTHMVNLDALIPREDFEALPSEQAAPTSVLSTTLKITDLTQDSLMYNVLRKPDFQRETANWTPEKVAELVRSFLAGDLIPSIILWRSPASGNIFVIDGAHRLSALAAWVQDDYGDKHTSIRFFDNSIPSEQKKAAEATRKLIQQSIGSYADLGLALRNPDTTSREKLQLARNLSAFAVHLQWVNGEAEKAESSFFRINQQATPIDPIELEMIKARRKPNALAARAFIRAGTGHKYWSSFEETVQAEIESLAKDVYDLIFKPNMDIAIRSADLPVAGRGYSADSVKMVFELVNFVNKTRRDLGTGKRGSRSQDQLDILADDLDGASTLKYMRAVKRTAGRIAGNEPASLGLHPAVYFYSATGRFQAAAFLAATEFIQELAEKNRLFKFTDIREKFEEFLVDHKYFLNQIVQAYGSLQRSVPSILKMYRVAFEAMAEGADAAEIVARLQADTTSPRVPVKVTTDDDRTHRRNFSAETKNSVFLKETLTAATRCEICRARLDFKSVTVDHKIRKEDGGTGAPSNAALTHPFCNSGYKESRESSRTA